MKKNNNKALYIMWTLLKSNRKNKKWMIINPNIKKIHFGDSRFEDFTIHKDVKRRKAYLNRHASRENWGASGINTAGFWSRWLLWNKPTLKESIKDLKKRFNVKISFH
jgi:hypothetical protein